MASRYSRQVRSTPTPPRSASAADALSGVIGVASGIALEHFTDQRADELLQVGLQTGVDTGDFNVPDQSAWDIIGRAASKRVEDKLRKAGVTHRVYQLQEIETASTFTKTDSPETRSAIIQQAAQSLEPILDNAADPVERAKLQATGNALLGKLRAKDTLFQAEEADLMEAQELEKLFQARLDKAPGLVADGDYTALENLSVEFEESIPEDATPAQIARYTKASRDIKALTVDAFKNNAKIRFEAGEDPDAIAKNGVELLMRNGIPRKAATQQVKQDVGAVFADSVITQLVDNEVNWRPMEADTPEQKAEKDVLRQEVFDNTTRKLEMLRPFISKEVYEKAVKLQNDTHKRFTDPTFSADEDLLSELTAPQYAALENIVDPDDPNNRERLHAAYRQALGNYWSMKHLFSTDAEAQKALKKIQELASSPLAPKPKQGTAPKPYPTDHISPYQIAADLPNSQAAAERLNELSAGRNNPNDPTTAAESKHGEKVFMSRVVLDTLIAPGFAKFDGNNVELNYAAFDPIAFDAVKGLDKNAAYSVSRQLPDYRAGLEQLDPMGVMLYINSRSEGTKMLPGLVVDFDDGKFVYTMDETDGEATTRMRREQMKHLLAFTATTPDGEAIPLFGDPASPTAKFFKSSGWVDEKTPGAYGSGLFSRPSDAEVNQVQVNGLMGEASYDDPGGEEGRMLNRAVRATFPTGSEFVVDMYRKAFTTGAASKSLQDIHAMEPLELAERYKDHWLPIGADETDAVENFTTTQLRNAAVIAEMGGWVRTKGHTPMMMVDAFKEGKITFLRNTEDGRLEPIPITKAWNIPSPGPGTDTSPAAAQQAEAVRKHWHYRNYTDVLDAGTVQGGYVWRPRPVRVNGKTFIEYSGYLSIYEEAGRPPILATYEDENGVSQPLIFRVED